MASAAVQALGERIVCVVVGWRALWCVCGVCVRLCARACDEETARNELVRGVLRTVRRGRRASWKRVRSGSGLGACCARCVGALAVVSVRV